MKIAVCDDDAICLAEVSKLIKEYAARNAAAELKYFLFGNGEDLLTAAEKIGGYDIYILDIVMPGMNGIVLGVELRRRGYDGRIIYLTSSEEHAIESFKAKPFDYILKPFDQATLCDALDQALKSVSTQKNRSIIVRTQEISIKLNLDSILYAERNHRVITYHLTDGRTVESIQIRTSFTEAIEELLKDSCFVLCGASMAVNLHHITAVENEALIFGNTYRAYLGKKACREIRSVWYDYTFDEEGSK